MASCGAFCPLRSVMALDLSPPSAWNGSWDDAEDNPSAAGALSAIACAIGAARACAACERTSCKRQVIGSNPLTGSQVSGSYVPFAPRSEERMSLIRVAPATIGKVIRGELRLFCGFLRRDPLANLELRSG